MKQQASLKVIPLGCLIAPILEFGQLQGQKKIKGLLADPDSLYKFLV